MELVPDGPEVTNPSPAQAKQDIMFPSSLFPHLEEDPQCIWKKKITDGWRKATLVALSSREVYHFLIFFFLST